MRPIVSSWGFPSLCKINVYEKQNKILCGQFCMCIDQSVIEESVIEESNQIQTQCGNSFDPWEIFFRQINITKCLLNDRNT